MRGKCTSSIVVVVIVVVIVRIIKLFPVGKTGRFWYQGCQSRIGLSSSGAKAVLGLKAPTRGPQLVSGCGVGVGFTKPHNQWPPGLHNTRELPDYLEKKKLLWFLFFKSILIEMTCRIFFTLFCHLEQSALNLCTVSCPHSFGQPASARCDVGCPRALD